MTYNYEDELNLRGPRYMPLINIKGVDHNAWGKLGLWGMPSKQQLNHSFKNENMKLVVTLQGREENNQTEKVCKNVGVDHIQIDFWKEYYAEKMDVISNLAEKIIKLLKSGQSVLIHCAAGIHRTGTLTYIILRKLGLPHEEAFEYLPNIRKATYHGVGKDRLTDCSKKYKNILMPIAF
eukprot:Mrub_11715.p1 GENE.Mrub_11715~~Mrub_11715.p1  ORF type:complete len:179 (-),score=15.38 Mrub_11715:32-568(-)